MSPPDVRTKRTFFRVDSGQAERFVRSATSRFQHRVSADSGAFRHAFWRRFAAAQSSTSSPLLRHETSRQTGPSIPLRGSMNPRRCCGQHSEFSGLRAAGFRPLWVDQGRPVILCRPYRGATRLTANGAESYAICRPRKPDKNDTIWRPNPRETYGCGVPPEVTPLLGNWRVWRFTAARGIRRA